MHPSKREAFLVSWALAHGAVPSESSGVSIGRDYAIGVHMCIYIYNSVYIYIHNYIHICLSMIWYVALMYRKIPLLSLVRLGVAIQNEYEENVQITSFLDAWQSGEFPIHSKPEVRRARQSSSATSSMLSAVSVSSSLLLVVSSFHDILAHLMFTKQRHPKILYSISII